MNWEALINLALIAIIAICFLIPVLTLPASVRRFENLSRDKRFIYYFLGLFAELIILFPAKNFAYKFSERVASFVTPKDDSPLLFLAFPLILLVGAVVYALTFLVLLGIVSFLIQHFYFRLSNKEPTP